MMRKFMIGLMMTASSMAMDNGAAASDTRGDDRSFDELHDECWSLINAVIRHTGEVIPLSDETALSSLETATMLWDICEGLLTSISEGVCYEDEEIQPVEPPKEEQNLFVLCRGLNRHS
ncbi:MAG: hypothetical protein LBR78_00610, partial [Holosporales bacterium]|nr:hypothetical protein [Holosporales bacterium]